MQQSAQPLPSGPGIFQCGVCEISCSSKDAFQAHIKGAKHLKTVNMYRRMGKPIPSITMPGPDGVTQVTAPRITFVGGQQLSSTGAQQSTQPSIYPPGVSIPSIGKQICAVILLCSYYSAAQPKFDVTNNMPMVAEEEEDDTAPPDVDPVGMS